MRRILAIAAFAAFACFVPGSLLAQGAGSVTPPPAAARGQLPGTATNDNAAAGAVGEYISSTVLSGSSIQLTSVTNADITSVSLTPGDWSCAGTAAISASAGTTTTLIVGWLSTTSATVPTAPNGGAYHKEQSSATLYTGGDHIFTVGPARYSLSSTTTVYLSTVTAFGTSTEFAWGFLGCWRAR